MQLNLADTYNDMIRKYDVLQSKINDDIIYSNMIGEFITPNCYVTIRSRTGGPGKKYLPNGHTCVFPDKMAIQELLEKIEKRIYEGEKVIFNEKLPGGIKLLYISTYVVDALNDYFGLPNGSNENLRDKQYNENTFTGNSEASLFAFKGKECAMCVERSLAAHCCFHVIHENETMKKFNAFPYNSFYHRTNATHIDRREGIGGHAMCVLLPEDRELQKMYFVDPSLGAKVINNNGEKYDVPAIYGLDVEEQRKFRTNQAVAPKNLLYCKICKDYKQISKIGYCTVRTRLANLRDMSLNNSDNEEFNSR